jgi:hypothetical protein
MACRAVRTEEEGEIDSVFLAVGRWLISESYATSMIPSSMHVTVLFGEIERLTKWNCLK